MVVLRYKRVMGASSWIRGHRPAHKSRPPSGPRADVNPGSVRWPRLAGHHLLMRCVLHGCEFISSRADVQRLRTTVLSCRAVGPAAQHGLIASQLGYLARTASSGTSTAAFGVPSPVTGSQPVPALKPSPPISATSLLPVVMSCRAAP